MKILDISQSMANQMHYQNGDIVTLIADGIYPPNNLRPHIEPEKFIIRIRDGLGLD
jgi:hypothetical protein